METLKTIGEEVNKCLSCVNRPCENKCPLENNIPDVIKLSKNSEYEKAYALLTKTTVLSSICGRICPHERQCQGACTLGYKSNPIAIR